MLPHLENACFTQMYQVSHVTLAVNYIWLLSYVKL